MHRSFTSFAAPIIFLAGLSSTELLAGEAAAPPKIMGDRDPELLLKVNDAINIGVEALREMQNPDGSWTGVWSGLPEPYKFDSGETALALLTLLRCGPHKHDEAVSRGFHWLRRQPLRRTCEVGLLLMLLEEHSKCWVPGNGFLRIPKKLWKPSSTDLGWMKECVSFLTGNAIAQPAKGKENPDGPAILWGYPWGHGDIINTMFTLRGLFGAHRCGVEVPGGIWERSMRGLEGSQENDGPVVQWVELVEHPLDGHLSRVPRIHRDKARGWPYKPLAHPLGWDGDRPHPAAGSTTCAGIVSFMAAYRGSGSSRKVYVSKAVSDGFAWLNLHWEVIHNPRHPERRWHYFFLASLHLAAELGARRIIGEHDWYREGAVYLLDKQNEGGFWADPKYPDKLSNTCFALLFLARETIPNIGPFRDLPRSKKGKKEEGEF